MATKATFSYQASTNTFILKGASLTEYRMIALAIQQSVPRNGSPNNVLVRFGRMLGMITTQLAVSK